MYLIIKTVRVMTKQGNKDGDKSVQAEITKENLQDLTTTASIIPFRFAEARLGGLSKEDQADRFQKIIRDIQDIHAPNHDILKHPIIIALRNFMTGEPIIGRRQQQQNPKPLFTAEELDQLTADVIGKQVGNAKPVRPFPSPQASHQASVELRNVELDKPPALTAKRQRSKSEPATFRVVNQGIEGTTSKIRHRATTTPLTTETPTSYTAATRNKNLPPASPPIGTPTPGITPKKSQAAASALVAVEDDNITDEITKAVRKQIIAEQLNLLKDTMVSPSFTQINQSMRERITKFNTAQFKDFLKTNDEGKKISAIALQKPELVKALRQLEAKGYREIHAKFSTSGHLKPVSWQTNPGNPHIRTTDIRNEKGNVITTLHEKTIGNARQVDFPTSITAGNTVTISMPAKDKNGQTVSEDQGIYFTAHYNKQGKLVEVSSPMPVLFKGQDKDAQGYIIGQDGQEYSLPVTKGKYTEMMITVSKNRGHNLSLEQNAALSAELSKDSIISTSAPQVSEGSKAKIGAKPEVDPEDLAIADELLKNHSSQYVLESLKGTLDKEKVTAYDILSFETTVKATSKDRPSRPPAVPFLTKEQLKAVYDYGMNEAAIKAKDPLEQNNIHEMCGKLIPELKKSYPLITRAHQDRAKENHKMLNYKQNLGLKEITIPFKECVAELESADSTYALKFLKDSVAKGKIETTEHIVDLTNPDKKPRLPNFPTLTKEQLKEAYMHGMEAASRAQSEAQMNKIHNASVLIVPALKDTDFVVKTHVPLFTQNVQTVRRAQSKSLSR